MQNAAVEMWDLTVTGLQKQNVKVQKQATTNNYLPVLTSGQSVLGDRLNNIQLICYFVWSFPAMS